MKIKVDREGLNAIHQLADATLRHGGLQSLEAVNLILRSCEEIVDEEEQTQDSES